MFLDHDLSLHIESDDQCASCTYMARGVACPLLHALSQQVVVLSQPVQVSNCGFYSPFERKLRVLNGGTDHPNLPDSVRGSLPRNPRLRRPR